MSFRTVLNVKELLLNICMIPLMEWKAHIWMEVNDLSVKSVVILYTHEMAKS